MAGNKRVVAVLGPTNTGKTTYAIERMLAHRTGVIGLPVVETTTLLAAFGVRPEEIA